MKPLTRQERDVLLTIFGLTAGTYFALFIMVEMTSYSWTVRDPIIILAWLSGALMTFWGLRLDRRGRKKKNH